MLTEKTRELSKRTKELDEIKNTNETYLASVERRYGEETALYRKRSGEGKGKRGKKTDKTLSPPYTFLFF